jgi:hypothetical protein
MTVMAVDKDIDKLIRFLRDQHIQTRLIESGARAMAARLAEQARAAKAQDPPEPAAQTPPPPLKPMTGSEWFFGVPAKGIEPAHKRFPRERPDEPDARWARRLSEKAEAEGVPLKWTSLVVYIRKLTNG